MSKLSDGLVTLRGRWYQLLQSLAPIPVPSVRQIYDNCPEYLPPSLGTLLEEKREWLEQHPGMCPGVINEKWNIPRPTMSSYATADEIKRGAKRLEDTGWKWHKGLMP